MDTEMNTTRRNFLGNLLVATAGFAILPGAGRVWRAERVVHRVTYRFVDLGWTIDPRALERLDIATWNVLVQPGIWPEGIGDVVRNGGVI